MSDNIEGHAGSADISIKLPDGTERTLPAGASARNLAETIGRRLAESAIAAEVDGNEWDLTRPLPDGSTVRIITVDTEDGRHVLRHSTAHVMAQAVTRLWPGAKFAIGPAIQDGFYYDFELPGGATFSEEDLNRIEQEMRSIIEADQPFVRDDVPVDEALQILADQPYKCEIIRNVDESEVESSTAVSLYRNSDTFVDLCRGPHVPTTKRLGHFKLQKVAGAYWRGNEKGPMLQRIYGTAWESKKALEKHLTMLEEAEKRDHRKLGTELDLFHFPPEIGGGLPVYHPKGGLIRKLMEDYSRSAHEEGGYEFVWTPHIAKSTLFETSGHLAWYAEGMYPPMELEGATYYPKPMNCPMHILIYRNRTRSYRELPLRLFEFGTVYRFERSGALHGLTRARGFTQDDSHIFCTKETLAPELASLLAFVIKVLRRFGLDDFEAELATRPEKFVGDPEEWDVATEALREALESADIPYVVAEGEGAFYAPKIDVHVRDAIGRRWQLSTLQVDFQLPHRFDLSYIGADNKQHVPYMIHRALFGSLDRFFGIMVEHYAGAFPLWLAPVQARVLPVRDDHEDYAADVVAALKSAGYRVESDHATEPLGGRIRRGKLEKIPYLLVVGDDDVERRTLGVNPRGGEVERGVSIESFLTRLQVESAQ